MPRYGRSGRDGRSACADAGAHATSARHEQRSVRAVFIAPDGLGNDDGVAGLQLDVLREVLALQHVFVVELEVDVLAVVLANDRDLALVGVLVDASGDGNQLEYRRRTADLVVA